MTSEMLALTILSMFAAAMWLPFIIGVTTTSPTAASPESFMRPTDLNKLKPWVHRAHRAHLNLIEQLVPFGLVVIIAHIQGISTSLTQSAAIAFVALRLIHAIGMISGTARFPIRPIIFTTGFICILIIGTSVLAA